MPYSGFKSALKYSALKHAQTTFVHTLSAVIYGNEDELFEWNLPIHVSHMQLLQMCSEIRCAIEWGHEHLPFRMLGPQTSLWWCLPTQRRSPDDCCGHHLTVAEGSQIWSWKKNSYICRRKNEWTEEKRIQLGNTFHLTSFFEASLVILKPSAKSFWFYWIVHSEKSWNTKFSQWNSSIIYILLFPLKNEQSHLNLKWKIWFKLNDTLTPHKIFSNFSIY